jgi:hypothetical protein
VLLRGSQLLLLFVLLLVGLQETPALCELLL